MSLWWSKQNKNGRRYLWQIDYDPLTVTIVIGLLAALIGSSLFRNHSLIIIYSPLAFLIAGLACLIISKISLIRKGILFLFGPGLMTKGYATLYKTAYLLLGVGVLLLLLILNTLRKA